MNIYESCIKLIAMNNSLFVTNTEALNIDTHSDMMPFHGWNWIQGPFQFLCVFMHCLIIEKTSQSSWNK